MGRQGRKRRRTAEDDHEEEVTSAQWEVIHMSEQEEDLIYRMHRLVGDRWELIAGRIPGRKPEEIERFWIMRSGRGLAEEEKPLEMVRSELKVRWPRFKEN